MSAYNDFMTIATQRYSCRSYSDRKVERDVISLVIDAARLAPSATNRQPWTFHIVDDGDLKQEIAACYGREWIKFHTCAKKFRRRRICRNGHKSRNGRRQRRQTRNNDDYECCNEWKRQAGVVRRQFI